MKPLRLLFLLLGIALLAFVVTRTDLAAVATHVGALGWAGALLIPAISILAFLADTWSWQLLISPPRRGGAWFYALWKVRMVGAAVNKVTPIVGLGGEPVKAVMLKKLYGLPYREGVASLLVAKTANLIALVIFLSIGIALAFAGNSLPEQYRLAAGAGLAVLIVGIGVVYAVQRLRIASSLGAWFSRRRYGAKIAGILHHLDDMDARLVRAYTEDRKRFITATFLTFLNWMIGAGELYLIFWFTGHPISGVEAVAITAAVELVRAGTFFIPASIGAEEAALVLIVTPITGQPGLGLAVALIRRYRELVYILWGFLIAWWMSGQSHQPVAELLSAANEDGTPP